MPTTEAQMQPEPQLIGPHRLPKSSRVPRVIFALTAVIVAAFVASQFLGVSATARTAFSDFAQLGAAVTAAFYCFFASRKVSSRERLSWRLWGGAAVAWTFGAATWTYFEVFTDAINPTPGISDIGFLSFLLLAICAMLATASRDDSARKVASALDAFLFASTLLVVAWSAFLSTVVNAAPSVPAAVTNVAYPVGDVIAISLTVLLAIRASDEVRTWTTWILGAFILLFIADVGLATGVAHGTYTTSQFTSIGWAAGLLTLAATAAAAAAAAAAARGESLPSRRRLPDGLGRGLPIVAVLTCFAAGIWNERSNGGFPDRPTQWGIGIIILVAVIRQVILSREYSFVSRQLEVALSDAVDRENWLNDTQRVAQIGSWELNLLTGQPRSSSEVARLFEFGPDERLTKEAIFARCHPDDRRAVEAAFGLAMSGKSVVEHRYLRKDGSVRWAHAEMEGIDASAGSPSRVIGTVQDITPRKVAELAEKKLREELAEAHRIAQLGSWTWDAQADQGVWSAELYRLLARDPSLGPTTFLRCPSLQTPGNLETLHATQHAGARTGTMEDLDLEVIVPDGQVRWVSLHSEIIGAPGSLLGLRGTMQDITRRKLAEIESMRRANHQAELRSVSGVALSAMAIPALLAAVAQLAAVGLKVPMVAFFEVDPGGRTLTVRASDGLPAEVTGATFNLDPDDVFGFTLHTRGPVVVTNFDHEVRFHASPLLTEHGIVSCISVTIHTQSGPFGVLAAYAATPRSFDVVDADFIEGVANIVASAIERGRAELSLRRNERLTSLGTLVAGVAHEVNNPLMYIQGSVELIQQSARELAPGLPDQQAVILETISSDAARAMRGLERIGLITKGLRQVARATGGARTTESLDAIVAGILPVASSRMGPNVRVETDFQSPSLVECNANEISQVVLNLLFNAADAMGQKGGLVRVGTADGRGSVALSVTDTGAGIPVEKRQQIFTPFFTTKPSGTGLGLSICHSIIAEHGGSLTFESEEGVGTTFRIQLPAAKVSHSRATP